MTAFTVRPENSDTLAGEKKPIRVLHVAAGNRFGGIERLLTTLAHERELCPAMQPEFALCFEGRLSRELQQAGAAVYLLGEMRLRNVRSVRQARRRLKGLQRSSKFDVVAVHSPWCHALLGPSTQQADQKLVFWMHYVASGKHWLERWARRTTPDLVLCVSQAVSETAERLFPRIPRIVHYSPAQLASGASQDARAVLREERNIPCQEIIILHAGRMERAKGQVLLLDALEHLHEIPHWQCWFAGAATTHSEKIYFKKLQRKTASAGLAGRVRFLGERKDILPLLHASDIYCQPNSVPEGFGMSLIEALSAGVPVITTQSGGAREIIDESCGQFVTGSHPGELAEVLRKLILDQNLRCRLGTSGPNRARHLCHPAKQLPELYDILDRLITGTQPTGKGRNARREGS